MLHLRRSIFFSGLLCASLGAARVNGQNVAEAARQERERKTAQAAEPHHVYTGEDLKRARILTPDDQRRVAAHKEVPPTPGKKITEPQVAGQHSETDSLGDVARRYRREKAARAAEQQPANGAEQSRYPLELPRTSLATPKPMVDPRGGSLHVDELRPGKRAMPPMIPNSSRTRLSPFAPRESRIPATPREYLPLAVIASSVRREQVQPGDSWWKLASRNLGKGSRWQELLRVNPGLNNDPKKLRAGTFVFVPADSQASAAAPGPAIIVEKGDTLWSLARKHLGCAQAWPSLAAANPQVTDFRKLQIGERLKLSGIDSAACSDSNLRASRN